MLRLTPKFRTSNKYDGPVVNMDGQAYVFQHNLDPDDIFVINPNDGRHLARPSAGVEYPLIGTYSGGIRSLYKHAMVTQNCPYLVDIRDISLLVRGNTSKPVAFSGNSSNALNPTAHNREAEIVSLFPSGRD